MFPVLDPAKLQDEQYKKFDIYVDYVRKPDTAPIPSGGTPGSMSKYFLNEKVLFRSNLNLRGYVRKCTLFVIDLSFALYCVRFV